ncbi:DUF1559 family PulG-like putative transporter [Planctomicrobium sp. SH664]|uniref:DUF1559 family PulG-like putative transporter n=1 Tax=Planctomicrobium sp. SH664 TaxID=3448125 RepID=UPI003F5C7D72
MDSPDSSNGVQPVTSKLLAIVFSGWVLAAVAIAVFIGFVITLLFPAVGSGPASKRSVCRNNLRQIGLALHNYVDRWGALPPAYTVDGNGNRLHSWRTLILPYLDQAPLYKRIDLSKPWDDPANRLAWEQTLPAYQCPGLKLPAGFTNYMAAVGPDYCFLPDRPRPLSEITDPLSATLMVFETTATEAVHWMSPHDASPEFFLTFNSKTKIPHASMLATLSADGTVRHISDQASRAYREGVLTVSGNESLTE